VGFLSRVRKPSRVEMILCMSSAGAARKISPGPFRGCRAGPASRRRLAGDTVRAATSVKEVVAEQALGLRLLKKSLIADGGGEE